MINEVSQKEKHSYICMISRVESKNPELIKTEWIGGC